MIREYPLFYCISPEAQAKLIIYQYETYSFHLTPPPEPYFGTGKRPDYDVTLGIDMDKFIRQAPRHQRRVA